MVLWATLPVQTFCNLKSNPIVSITKTIGLMVSVFIGFSISGMYSSSSLEEPQLNNF